MSDPFTDDSAALDEEFDRSRHRRADDPEMYPPVRPPSAGFIVQLFLVPALIVAAIVGVWALFGRIAAGEQDWRELVQELRSNNEHRRWRAALGLAHLLEADQERAAADQRLTRNPQVARALAELLGEQLDRRSQKDDDIKQEAFVARTLGTLDVPEVVLPALQRAIRPEHELEVRKNALASIALIAGRAAEQAAGKSARALTPSLSDPDLIADVVEVSREGEPLVRQLAAYTLGLLAGEDAEHRLQVMLNDADRHARTNAAVALARRGSTEGLDVLRELLADPPEAKSRGELNRDAANDLQMHLAALRNALRAVGELAPNLPADDRQRLIELIAPIADKHGEAAIRVAASEALVAMKNVKQP
ncbi:MAG: HEAT repeat domain-containing protein [Planctomycetes bacterium]|nr:HEAT repeat domain-containing protein [Planctomycetota bacterium]